MALIELNYDEALKLLKEKHLSIESFLFPRWQPENIQHTYMDIVVLKAKCENFLDLALQIQKNFN